ncbi:MAG: 16S rRNA (guanine(527)-N(7))-methyltransferase RsmG [Bacteroidales bacterium]|nr:16S rRNA (guanine(527)-N(7))-methyltransferase RsmG [Bacteroidales bacterium]
MQSIFNYFPDLIPEQYLQYQQLEPFYRNWNSKINLISRKDIDEIYLHHMLHSLSIAKLINFKPGTSIMDVGTGGGFPGIPLAIMFPEAHFYLIDSIGKKIKVVNTLIHELGLKNCTAEKTRAEDVGKKFDFIVSRAVTNLPNFVNWVKGKIHSGSKHQLPNGILYLKGGDFSEELKTIKQKITVFTIQDFFSEPYFTTKNIIHVKINT